MRMIAPLLLIVAVVAAGGAEPVAISLPDSDTPERVLETVESVRAFIGELAQIAGDLISLARDVFGWLEAGVGYLERLMELAESGMGLVNETVERGAPSP
ncbi:MAG: hypothetical protein KO254_04600 [Methanoculleus marisnigri]|nr:hypothetical protein [Methanoculleus marisnigri]